MKEQQAESKETSERSPFAGCAIFVVIAVVLVFLVGFSVVVLFKQFDKIAAFTDEKAKIVGIESVEDREGELNVLAEKLEGFRLAVKGDAGAVMELSVGEMNLAIAAYEQFRDLRGTLRVREISKESLLLDISFRLNGKPRLAKDGEVGVIGSDPRFLNGLMKAKPGIMDGEVVLEVLDIKVEGREVPAEFIERMSPYRIAERYVGDGGIGQVMPRLTGVELGDGLIQFEKKVGEKPKNTIEKDDVDAATRRLFVFFGVASTLFLIFVAFVLFWGIRLKKRNENAVLEK